MRLPRPLLLACALAAGALAPHPAPAAPAGQLLTVRRVNHQVPPPAIQPLLRQLAERRQLLERVRLSPGPPPAVRAARHARPQAARRYSAANPEVIRVLALRVDFLHDSVGTQTTGNGRFDLTPDSTVLVDPPPHNRAYFVAHMQALANFCRAQSYGSLQVDFDVYPHSDTGAYHLRDVADYGPFRFSQDIVPQIQRFIRDSFHAADTSGDNIPWTSFDRVILFHAGADFQTDVRQDSPYDIPSLTFMDTLPVARTFDRTAGDTARWYGCSLIPETDSQDGLIGAVNGTLAHEFGHLLRWHTPFDSPVVEPDLYNTTSGLPVVGTWSLHDSGNFLGTLVGKGDNQVYAVGLVPGSDDPWSKWTVLYPDAMNPIGFEGPDTTLALGDAEDHPDFVVLPVGQDEYFLLENRETDPDAASADDSLFLKADSTSGVVLGPARRRVVGTDTTVVLTPEYDVLQPASGILCWHIDNSVLDLRGVNVPPDSGLNTNINRPAIGLIQGDGSKSLGDPGSPFFQGGPFDPFSVGNLGVGLPEDGRPDSRGNSGGLTHVSFLTLDGPGPSLRVRIQRSRALRNWPLLGDMVTRYPAGAPAVAMLHGAGAPEFFAAAAGGVIHGFRLDGAEFSGAVPGAPFVSEAYDFEPELLAMPGWAPGGGDALLAELHDDSTGAPRSHLVAYDGAGRLLPGFPAASAPLTTPLVRWYDQVLAGAADGRVWSFARDGSALIFGDSTGFPVLGRIAVGPFAPGGDTAVVVARSAAADGALSALEIWPLRLTVGLAPDAARTSPPRLVAARPAAAAGARGATTAEIASAGVPGGRLTRPVLVGAYTDSLSYSPTTLFVVDSTGWISAWRGAGLGLPLLGLAMWADNTRPGFPFQLPSPPSGTATLGNITDDGRPCILVPCRDGLLYAIGLDGRPLPGFPAPLPTGNAPLPGSAVIQCRTLQGRPLILAPTTSGDLAGLDAHGKMVDGFPWAVGSTWGTGCSFASDGHGGTWLVSVGGTGGWSLDSLPGVLQSGWVSQGPGVDDGRTGFLPRVRVAVPLPAASYADLGNLRAYPNPLRVAQLGELRVSFELSRAADVRLRLYRLNGQVAVETRWPGHAAGNVATLQVARLGTGLYELEALLGDSGRRVVTPVAIVQ
ncbi:MAG TPA: hypothetical protein VMS93_08495 [Candidatus Saccharimonadales bacterium]|nr:hypothetical protein [Candidatus Saccharimonadales bacterium]